MGDMSNTGEGQWQQLFLQALPIILHHSNEELIGPIRIVCKAWYHEITANHAHKVLHPRHPHLTNLAHSCRQAFKVVLSPRKPTITTSACTDKNTKFCTVSGTGCNLDAKLHQLSQIRGVRVADINLSLIRESTQLHFPTPHQQKIRKYRQIQQLPHVIKEKAQACAMCKEIRTQGDDTILMTSVQWVGAWRGLTHLNLVKDYFTQSCMIDTRGMCILQTLPVLRHVSFKRLTFCVSIQRAQRHTVDVLPHILLPLANLRLHTLAIQACNFVLLVSDPAKYAPTKLRLAQAVMSQQTVGLIACFKHLHVLRLGGSFFCRPREFVEPSSAQYRAITHDLPPAPDLYHFQTSKHEQTIVSGHKDEASLNHLLHQISKLSDLQELELPSLCLPMDPRPDTNQLSTDNNQLSTDTTQTSAILSCLSDLKSLESLRRFVWPLDALSTAHHLSTIKHVMPRKVQYIENLVIDTRTERALAELRHVTLSLTHLKALHLNLASATQIDEVAHAIACLTSLSELWVGVATWAPQPARAARALQRALRAAPALRELRVWQQQQNADVAVSGAGELLLLSSSSVQRIELNQLPYAAYQFNMALQRVTLNVRDELTNSSPIFVSTDWSHVHSLTVNAGVTCHWVTRHGDTWPAHTPTTMRNLTTVEHQARYCSDELCHVDQVPLSAPNLQAMELVNRLAFTPKTVSYLVQTCTQLRDIRLECLYWDVTPASLACFAQLPHLTHLKLQFLGQKSCTSVSTYCTVDRIGWSSRAWSASDVAGGNGADGGWAGGQYPALGQGFEPRWGVGKGFDGVNPLDSPQATSYNHPHSPSSSGQSTDASYALNAPAPSTYQTHVLSGEDHARGDWSMKRRSPYGAPAKKYRVECGHDAWLFKHACDDLAMTWRDGMARLVQCNISFCVMGDQSDSKHAQQVSRGQQGAYMHAQHYNHAPKWPLGGVPHMGGPLHGFGGRSVSTKFQLLHTMLSALSQPGARVFGVGSRVELKLYDGWYTWCADKAHTHSEFTVNYDAVQECVLGPAYAAAGLDHNMA